jgi:hypothetical protein
MLFVNWGCIMGGVDLAELKPGCFLSIAAVAVAVAVAPAWPGQLRRPAAAAARRRAAFGGPPPHNNNNNAQRKKAVTASIITTFSGKSAIFTKGIEDASRVSAAFCNDTAFTRVLCAAKETA